MFDAPGQSMDGDHLDLSYRDTSTWPHIGPGGLVASLWVSIGDPTVGPAVQLIKTSPIPQEFLLDAHFHGSDQFRMSLHGDGIIAGRRLAPGEFVLHEAGRPYREGIGPSDESHWLLILMGSRRGARTTYVRGDGGALPTDTISDDQLDLPIPTPDDPYWSDIPGGAKGVPAIRSTLGSTFRGFLWGTSNAVGVHAGAQPVTAAVLGDAVSGPVVFTVSATADQQLLGPSMLPTELMLVVIDGSCRVGDDHYEPGDVRVQRASAPTEGVVAGLTGLRAILIVADRRMCRPVAQEFDIDVDGLVSQLAATG